MNVVFSLTRAKRIIQAQASLESGESSRVVQTSEDVIMGDTCFGANNYDDVMDVSSVEAEAGSVVLDSSDESIGKVSVYGVIWPSNNNR